MNNLIYLFFHLFSLYQFIYCLFHHLFFMIFCLCLFVVLLISSHVLGLERLWKLQVLILSLVLFISLVSFIFFKPIAIFIVFKLFMVFLAIQVFYRNFVILLEWYLECLFKKRLHLCFFSFILE